MLRRVILLMLFFVPLTRAEVVAHITQVTLYRGSATVERTAEVAAGARPLEVGGVRSPIRRKVRFTGCFDAE